jgi:hypothetical protein
MLYRGDPVESKKTSKKLVLKKEIVKDLKIKTSIKTGYTSAYPPPVGGGGAPPPSAYCSYYTLGCGSDNTASGRGTVTVPPTSSSTTVGTTI